MVKVAQNEITYEAEHSILCYLSGIHDGPWSCSRCDQEITAETGWKPFLWFMEAPNGGVRTVVTHLVCGPCVPAAQVEQRSWVHGDATETPDG